MLPNSLIMYKKLYKFFKKSFINELSFQTPKSLRLYEKIYIKTSVYTTCCKQFTHSFTERE